MTTHKDDSIQQLEIDLARLANLWRRYHSIGELDTAEAIVVDYLAIFETLWSLGWDGEGLLPDSELPDELMPDCYIQRWSKKRV